MVPDGAANSRALACRPLARRNLVQRVLAGWQFPWLRVNRTPLAIPLSINATFVRVFGDVHLDRQLTSELLPTGGDPTMVLAVIGMLLWRARSPGWNARQLLNRFS